MQTMLPQFNKENLMNKYLSILGFYAVGQFAIKKYQTKRNLT